MREVSISSAVEKLDGSTVTLRNEGLDDLKFILGQSRGTSRLEPLGDEGYHKIFEALFRIVRVEKPKYLKATTAGTRSNAISRLGTAAAALRIAVEAGSLKIKHKTANAVLDHIVGTLPTADRGLCPPLRNDYLKSLRVLLEFAPHGEHLRKKQWQALVDFILEALTHDSADGDSNATATPSRNLSVDSRNGNNLSVRISQASGTRNSRTESASYVDDLMSCVRLLVGITNAPLMSKAPDLVQTLTEHIAASGRSQETAFESLNIVLTILLTENISLARTAVQDVLPIIRRLWSTKFTSLREQMLTTLAISDRLFLEAANTKSRSESFQTEGLLAALMQDYARKPDREVLQLDDVVFWHGSEPPLLCTRTLTPVVESPRAVSSWVILSVMTSLIIGQDKSHSEVHGHSPADGEARKRPRLSSPIDELVQQAASTGQGRLCAIQLLIFITDRSSAITGRIRSDVMRLVDGALEDDSSIASWTHIMFAQLAHSHAAADQIYNAAWQQVWTSAIRNLSAASTCRAACHLINSMLRTKVLKDVVDPRVLDAALYSNGANGPSVFSDAALDLWMYLMTSRLFDSHEASQAISNKCVQWLNTYWAFPSVLDRLHMSQLAFHAQTDRLYQLLMAAMRKKTKLQTAVNTVITSPLYRTLLRLADSIAFSRYLLDLNPITTNTNTDTHTDGQVVGIDYMELIRPQQAVLDMLLSKIRSFQEAWSLLGSERSNNITNDVVHVSATLCTTSQALCIVLRQSLPRKCESLSILIGQFWETICNLVAKQEFDVRRRSLITISGVLLRLQASLPDDQIALAQSRAILVSPVINLMRVDLDSQKPGMNTEIDLMELDESLPSHPSQTSLETTAVEGPRQHMPIISDPNSALVHFASSLTIDLVLSRQSDHIDTNATSEIIDFMYELSPGNLLAASLSLTSFLKSAPGMTRADATRMFERLGEVCLQNDDFERCESSLCFCLDIMATFAHLWSAGDDDLASVGSDIYSWYLKVAMGKAIASPKVMFGITTMLEAVMKADPSFGADVSLPSPRTSLLQILKGGDNNLRYHLSGKISHLFDHFVLTEHDAIFNDVLESLPSDPEETEGIAARLFVLGELASKWHTVLRRAIYHLFETPAKIPASAKFAQHCLRKVCSVLDVKSPRSLLMLFCPQILYTWLENETIDSIPFETFEYPSLQDLLLDLQDELVGQIGMRASDNMALSLSALTGITWSELLSQSFAKAEAYTVAKDINFPRETGGTKSSESSIRKVLGSEAYLSLVRSRFPEIISALFATLDDLQSIESAFMKYRFSAAAKGALQSICGRSQSTITLPAGQQPSFRAKHLMAEIQFLCLRIDEDPAKIWTPAMLIYLYRTLLDDAVPALGPLHACSILRKLRILVSLAGSQALEGYPLEMLLHNIRPYLTNFHCSEDALGICWYLLEHGRVYLRSCPSFVISLSVAIFAALSEFLKSSQDSTTQESHFRSTMSKVQQFHEWFVKYLLDFKPSTAEPDLAKRFSKISQLSGSVTKGGTSVKGVEEGDLLFAMLEDQLAKPPLLTLPAFRVAIEILCNKFDIAENTVDDILGNQADADRFAPVLASLVHQTRLPRQFLAWIAQTLGRSHTSKGSAWRPTTGRPSHNETASITTSYLIILRHLEAIIRQEDRQLAGLAERTLQSISSALSPEDRLALCDADIRSALLDDLALTSFPFPQLRRERGSFRVEVLKSWVNELTLEEWSSALARELCIRFSTDALLTALPDALTQIPKLATLILPSIVHIALSSDEAQHNSIRESLSSIFSEALKDRQVALSGHLGVIVNILLHLRRMPIPRETTMADRNNWLEIDLGQAAAAAMYSNMSSAALLFLELKVSQQSLHSRSTSRRSTLSTLDDLADIMPAIFQGVDDPDFFYSVEETPTMASLVKKLTHEGSDSKAVSIQSAIFDSNIKSSLSETTAASESAIFSALSNANLDGLARVVQGRTGLGNANNASKCALQVSMNLHQWDLPIQTDQSVIARTVLEVFHTTKTAPDRFTVRQSIDRALWKTLDACPVLALERGQVHEQLSAMAILAEMREALSVTSYHDLEEICQKFDSKNWSENESFEKVSPLLLGREALFAIIKKSDRLRDMVNISALEAQLLEIKTVRSSLKIARDHQASQFCLNRAVYLSRLSELAVRQGLKVDAVAQQQLAAILWDQGEAATSIQILRMLRNREDLAQQSMPISLAEILADLGHEIAEARLDKPDEIIRSYLLPAIRELNGRTVGAEAGRVFHDFAAFCDMQLQNADDLDDFGRIEKIRDRKEKEVLDLERMVRNEVDAKQKETLRKHHLEKAKTWFKLDDEEYKRLKANRDRFAQQCLENYLLSLTACDDYNNDVLRFVALWMSQSENSTANSAVEKHISSVPTRKFAPLMNQLSSRILDQKSAFQPILFNLLYRICCDHPYHSLYQVFATSKSKGAKNDEVATSRYTAATKLASYVMKTAGSGALWVAIHNSSIAFVRLASERLSEKKLKSGSKIALRELQTGLKLEQTIHDAHTKTAPPTMKIQLRADRDYRSVPTFSQFDPQLSIAGGVSAPKIVSIIASDGSRHKMLLKGGNDDLRQDSIMEQVFEQVSNLLKDHRATRQRNLGIRTYKVIPLTPNAGIIEFVKDTIPLHDYLLPAHQRYFPKDYKPSRCRKEIADAQTKSLAQRLQAYRAVCANFHPVMRFFFMEHFLDPDEWFQKRLNYSRSTATISILGHVLGLGDRHGHNILLDERTGEVVHIDLGVAFEAGRVLPVPEVVPFRLTRDLVDGMGLSGVEGVFRRCCNFTLEALRLDQYSIMTILDVLRYDPLYSWSLSPLRQKRMQEEQENAAAAAAAMASNAGPLDAAGPSVTSSVAGTSFIGRTAGTGDVNAPSEADRVLTVVAKKLGKSLSAEATVNELIQQATDEKNLACLYCGWAAYA